MPNTTKQAKAKSVRKGAAPAKAPAKSAPKAAPKKAAKPAAKPVKVPAKPVKAASGKQAAAPAKQAKQAKVPVSAAKAKAEKVVPAAKVAPAVAAKPAPAPEPVVAAILPPPPPPDRRPDGKIRKGRKLMQLILPAAAKPLDLETKRTRLKSLIALGKERGFLTYAEINDHLPDDLVDAEQIESMISAFSDMGIKVFDEAPAAEELLLNEAPPAQVDEQEVEEEAEQALSTVESEFGRTTDPVRMYMREMGTVELLTREGEIEIAKRIEDGLKHMVMAISACPTTIAEMLELAGKVARDEMRIDELIDGLIDPHAADQDIEALAESEELEVEEEEVDEDDDGSAAVSASLLLLKQDALERFSNIHHLYGKLQGALVKRGSQDKIYLRLQKQISSELINVRFTARTIERLCDSVRHSVEQVRAHERKILHLCVDKAHMPRSHFIKVFPGNEINME